ncbi:NADH-ubiquinone oxidoreductase B18 subunit-domain-containing protein [Zopfochytrium polystomum]|nr:NADH-ubiquinone oxidoreductase B18 subunit-domain-containing protein [Zopfochytrium polystomum]
MGADDHHNHHNDSDGHDDTAPPKMHITQRELAKERIPLAWRDYCSHLLPELNKCRRENNYLPWRCQKERMVWNKCQYDDYMRRMRLADKQRQVKEEAKLAAA